MISVLDLAPATFVPGSDAGVTSADWHWLKRQLNIHQDWELNTVRLSFTGRVIRLRKNPDVSIIIEEPYIAGPGGPYKNPTSSPRYGHRQWDYRARKPPLRQRPEWQLSDADVIDVCTSLDLRLLQKTCPSTLAMVVETLVSSLARPPQLTQHVHRLEYRLAAIMHATIATPVPGRFRVFQWLDCRKRIRRVWLKWGGHLTDGDGWLETTNRLEEGCGLPPTAPSSAWLRQAHDLLKSIGLHILGVPSDLVFRHRPAPNMNQRDARRQILEEHALFRHMELGAAGGFPAGLEPERFNALHHECPACKMHMDMEQCTCEHEAGVWWGPRGRLFMFQRHFRRYNEIGMAREDPTAHRWRPEKLIYDLTWCMPVAAWQTAVSNLQVREQRCLVQIWKAHKKAGDPLLQSIISEYSTWGPDNKIWESLGIPISYTRCPPEGSHAQGSSMPAPAVATATRHAEQNSVPPPVVAPTTPLPKHKSSEASSPSDVKPRRCPELTPLSRRLQMTTCKSWGGQRETELFEKFRSLSPFELVGSLQWLGGTYAAHPQFFPREQSELEWITQSLLPLGILPPRRFITWRQFQWQPRHTN